MGAVNCRSLVLIFSIGSLAAACSGTGSLSSLTSPTAPTTVTTPAPVPPIPGSSAFTLSGRVTETAPTPQTGIAGALVRIASGQNAGRSVTSNQMGFYSISDVEAGNTINVSAEGYIETSRSIVSSRDMSSFQLMPVPQTTTTTMSDTLSSQVGTCNDGVTMRPCHILTVPIHNSGPLEATLSWNPGDAADLNLTLFQTGSSSFISRSASIGPERERISVNLTNGATYELRVTYASGTGAPKYTLRATHQN